MIALFVSGMSANDGDLGNGGYTCDGDLGNGGRTCSSDCVISPENTEPICIENSSQSDSDDSLLSTIQEYLNELFGTGGN